MIKKQHLIFIFLLWVTVITAQITVSLNPVNYSINPALLGLNGRSTEGPSWTDNNFLTLVKEMNPSYIRYPAGTQGNQWNWKTGTFIAWLNMTPKEIFTIPMFVNGLPPNSKIIYMVNMVLPTEQTGISFSTTTDAVLETSETLTAKVSDILNALDAFDKAGHLPEVCELGNELYFTNTYAGVYANNPSLYINHAKIIALAIKNRYPSIKLLFCTTKGGTTNRDAWNNYVYNAIDTDSQLMNIAYGVVQHHYINDNYGIMDDITTNALAKTIIDEGISYVESCQSDYDGVPSSLKLWLTEYGSTKTTADGMWASGLRTATMTLSFMKLGQKLDNLTWHHITEDPNILNANKTELGPSGIVFSLLSKAMNGSDSYNKIIFSNMTSTNQYASLSGYKFSANGEERILILNTDNVTYTGINLSVVAGTGTLSYGKQYWNSTPYITGISTSTNISVSSSSNLNSYKINPFSLTLLIKKNSTTATGPVKNENKLNIWPVVIVKALNIEVDTDASYKIVDLTGRNIYQGNLQSGVNTINAQHFNKGINFITIKNQSYKVIRW